MNTLIGRTSNNSSNLRKWAFEKKKESKTPITNKPALHTQLPQKPLPTRISILQLWLLFRTKAKLTPLLSYGTVIFNLSPQSSPTPFVKSMRILLWKVIRPLVSILRSSLVLFCKMTFTPGFMNLPRLRAEGWFFHIWKIFLWFENLHLTRAKEFGVPCRRNESFLKQKKQCLRTGAETKVNFS